jgi:hypothetical protein
MKDTVDGKNQIEAGVGKLEWIGRIVNPEPAAMRQASPDRFRIRRLDSLVVDIDPGNTAARLFGNKHRRASCPASDIHDNRSFVQLTGRDHVEQLLRRRPAVLTDVIIAECTRSLGPGRFRSYRFVSNLIRVILHRWLQYKPRANRLKFTASWFAPAGEGSLTFSEDSGKRLSLCRHDISAAVVLISGIMIIIRFGSSPKQMRHSDTYCKAKVADI